MAPLKNKVAHFNDSIMDKVILLGKPNVGKSSLFNLITREKNSIVLPERNITRDVVKSIVRGEKINYEISDLGGLTDEKGPFLDEVRNHIYREINDCQLIIALFDSDNIDKEDQKIISIIRKQSTPRILVANKIDQEKDDYKVFEIHRYFGEEMVLKISCHAKRNLVLLRNKIEDLLLTNKKSSKSLQDETNKSNNIKDSIYDYTLSILGRPNAGKSSLLNLLCGYERSIVSSKSGTTRDSVDEIIELHGKKVRIFDTAGMRKKNTKKEQIEKDSIQRAIRSLSCSDICLLLIDAVDGIGTQDKKITSLCQRRSKALVIVINKWDKSPEDNWRLYEERFRREFPHINNTPLTFISCKTKKNFLQVTKNINRIYQSFSQRISTHKLNEVVEMLKKESPPSGRSKKLKIYYLLQVKAKPPIFKIFINKKIYLHKNYVLYLEHSLAKQFNLNGTNFKIIFSEKKNEL